MALDGHRRPARDDLGRARQGAARVERAAASRTASPAEALDVRTLGAAVGATDPRQARALRPDAVLRLQAKAGNAAVVALLRPPGARRAAALRLQKQAKARSARLAAKAPLPASRATAGSAQLQAAPAEKADEDDVDTSEFTDDPKAAAAKLATLPPPAKVTTPAPVLPGPAPGPVKGPGKVAPPRKLAPPVKKGVKGGKKAASPKAAPAAGTVVRRPVPPPPARYRFRPGMELPPPPAEVTPVRPADDPAFARMAGQARKTVKATRKHATGRQESAAAQEAAEPPANDKLSQAKANRAETMGAARPRPFDEEAFVAAVEAALAKAAPKNLEQAEQLDERSAGMKQAIGSKVAGGKQAAAGDVDAKAKEPPDPSTAVEKPVTAMTPVEVAPPQPVSASAAMPAPAPREQLDLRRGPAEVDQEMASAGVTEEQLAESNEPTFGAALEAKNEGEEHAAKAPGDVRRAEATILGRAAAESAAAEKAAVTGAQADATKATTQIGGDKGTAKSKDEQARKQVADNVEKIFDRTKADVDGILEGLDGKVEDLFTTGEAAVREAFTKDWNKRLDDYKDRRYSGLRGPYRWTRDLFRGLPPEANDLFQLSRAVYERQMKQLVRRIAQLVSEELAKATARIDEGRKQVADYVGSLKGDLAEVGQEAAAGITEKFADLDSSVKEKFDDLASGLARKYAASREAVDEEIKAAQEANKGLIDKAIGAVQGVIEVIRQLKDMVLGVFRKIADVIGDIIAHPIRFLENFVSAVKEGVQAFSAKIEDHLQKGLMGWLMGSLEAKGVEIPKSFDVPGMLKLVIAVIGATWTWVRERLVKKVTEAGAAALEKGSDLIKKIMGGGVGAIWEQILEKVSDFADLVIVPIKDFIVNKVVRAGIEFLVGMLNPAAAFVKACKMIYGIVMFFVERGKQIRDFVETVIDAAGDIARGGKAGVPAKIEGSLAKFLPLAISFLASLLGLGGVSEKVKSIIAKVRGPITRAIDSILGFVVKTTRPIWEKAKRLYQKGKARATDLYAKGKAKVEAGKQWAKAKAKAARDKVSGLFKRQVVPMPVKGEQHSLVAEPEGKGLKLYMHSEPTRFTLLISVFVDELEARAEIEPPDRREATQRQITALRKLWQEVADKEKDVPRAERVTPTGAPPGFDRWMRGQAEKGRHLLKAAAGTEVDMTQLGAFGMPLASYMQAQEVADRTDATIDIRGTNVEAPELLAMGHQPKPERFKEKTVTELDVKLGIPPEYLGRMAWFNPVRPPATMPSTMDAAEWKKLNERFEIRRNEYLTELPDMRKRLLAGQFSIIPGGAATADESGEVIMGGVVTLKGELEGLAYTGDHDLFDIRPQSKAAEVQGHLKAPPFRVQHGAHMTWTMLPATLAQGGLSPRDRMIYETILRKHGPQNGESLLRIRPRQVPVTARAYALPPLPKHEEGLDKADVFQAEPAQWEKEAVRTGRFTTEHDTLLYGGQAVVNARVVTRVLDPTHQEGQRKGPAFKAALGFDLEDGPALVAAVMVGARTEKATPGRVDDGGARFVVVIPVAGAGERKADVRTTWIYRPGSKKPVLLDVELA